MAAKDVDLGPLEKSLKSIQQTAADTAGAFGGMVGGLTQLPEALIELGSGLLHASSATMVLKTSQAFLSDTYEAASNVVTGLVGTMVGFIGTFGGVTAAALVAKTAFDGFIGPISDLVKFFNPAAVELLNMAMEDLQATLGQSLQPIIYIAIDLIQKLGDFIGGIDFEPIVSAVTEVLKVLEGAFFNVLEAIRPLVMILIGNFATAIKDMLPIFTSLIECISPLIAIVATITGLFSQALTGALELIAPVITTVADGLVLATKGLILFFNTIADWMDKLPGFAMAFGDLHIASIGKQLERNKDNDNRSTAARGVNIGGIEDASRRALQSAGKVGIGGGPAKKTADNTTAILALLKSLAPNMFKDPAAAHEALLEARDGAIRGLRDQLFR